MLSFSVFSYLYVVFLTIFVSYVVSFCYVYLVFKTNLSFLLLYIYIRAKFNWELRKSILMKRIKVKTKGMMMMIYDDDDDL